MAVHEFGIMPEAPVHGRRFDEYEPGGYRCMSVDDAFIEHRLWDFLILPCYAHSVDIPCAGLCDCGVTLIPPHAAREMFWMVHTDRHLAALAELLARAGRENKWIIHFGL